MQDRAWNSSKNLQILKTKDPKNESSKMKPLLPYEAMFCYTLLLESETKENNNALLPLFSPRGK